jgi:hypothetical protein
MNTEERIKNLEDKIQENFDIFNNKLVLYNNKINEIVEHDGVVKTTNSESKINFKNILNLNSNMSIIIVIVIIAIVGYILYKTKPDFVCNVVTNKDTFFNEKHISNFKLLLYTVCITILIIIAIYLSMYVYKMKK